MPIHRGLPLQPFLCSIQITSPNILLMRSRLYLLMLPLVAAVFFETKAQSTHTTLCFLDDGTSIYFDPTLKPFYHGVASGDPLSDAVIIWTRVTPETKVDTVRVKWRVALDEDFTHIEAEGETTTSPSRDFTVKIDAKGLHSGSFHYYQFEAFGKKSPVGRTKTTGRAPRQNQAYFTSHFPSKNLSSSYPSPNDQVRLAVVSCNNFQAGYFNAFARIAEIDDLDAVVHLGDYIYEYGAKTYADSSVHDRVHLPTHEIVSLQDYRTRYAQYRLDPDLQAVHQKHPFICVWDDHEISNNAYSSGAENHQPNEGDFELRKIAASKAYYEWLPVREGNSLYRQFSFGSGLADLFMLDERVAGREQQPDSRRSKLLNAKRTMLGEEQLAWLENGLKNANSTWKIIGNQVLFAELSVSYLLPKIYVNFDAWDGYPTERQAIKDFLAAAEIPNVIFATGDTHAAWCFDIPQDFEKYKQGKSEKIVAHEFATASVTSANFDEYRGEKTVKFLERAFASQKTNPHLRYLDLCNHGYLLLTLTPYDAMAEWRFVEDIRHRTSGEFVGEKRVVKAQQLPELARGEASLGGSK
ncbi:MAG: alkaline phosphatase [Bacteroidetes bacterium]|nr:alkaline phosphatase [Bacteroidota bacterium]